MRSFWLSLILLFVILVPYSGRFFPALAQEEEQPEGDVKSVYYPPTSTTGSGFLGQDHKYTVVFRGNGEAVVSLRVTFTNKEDSDVSKISLRVPKVEPKDLNIYQILQEARCTRYKQPEYDPDTKRYIPVTPPVCEEYQSIDYYNYYGSAKYQKADYDMKGDTLTIDLPEDIKPNTSGSYFVYFRAFGYAKKNLVGRYQYTFETLKVEDEIRNLSVGVTTDSDLFLKGVKGQVNYRLEESAVTGASGALYGAAPQKSVALDRFVGQIGTGTLNKTASNLSPSESFNVKGAFADSRLKLFAGEIAVVVIVIVLIIILIFLAIRSLVRRLNSQMERSHEEAGDVKKVDKANSSSIENTRFAMTAVGVSFVSSFLIAGYTILIMLGGQVIDDFVGYQYEFFFVLMIILISFGVYTTLLLGPAVYMGIKKGIGWGIATLVFTILWLFVYLLAGLFVIFVLGFSRSFPSYPDPILY